MPTMAVASRAHAIVNVNLFPTLPISRFSRTHETNQKFLLETRFLSSPSSPTTSLIVPSFLTITSNSRIFDNLSQATLDLKYIGLPSNFLFSHPHCASDICITSATVTTSTSPPPPIIRARQSSTTASLSTCPSVVSSPQRNTTQSRLQRP